MATLKIGQKILLLTLSMVLFFCLLGCDNSPAEPQVNQIVAKTIAAMANIKSYGLYTYLTQNYVVIVKSNPSTTNDLWQWSGWRRVDVSKKEMYLNMNIREPADNKVTPYIYESYIVGGWQYNKQSSPPVGGTTNPWSKTKLDEQNSIWSYQTQIAPQIELLSRTTDIILSGMESLDGKEYYILDLGLSAETATDWILSQQQISGPSLGWFRTSGERNRQIYIAAFMNGNARLWIDKNSYVISKVNIDLLFDAIPGNILRSDTGLIITGQEDPTDVGFEHIIRSFSGQWEFTDYNKPVDIQLPEDALDAIEYSS
jgi:hypothetical protein